MGRCIIPLLIEAAGAIKGTPLSPSLSSPPPACDLLRSAVWGRAPSADGGRAEYGVVGRAVRGGEGGRRREEEVGGREEEEEDEVGREGGA